MVTGRKMLIKLSTLRIMKEFVERFLQKLSEKYIILLVTIILLIICSMLLGKVHEEGSFTLIV